MRKEDQERFLQNKYPAKASLKDRPRTQGLLSQPRITLSDLPPEEKLKIGELIKINESRRVEIAQLTEQLSSSQSALADCHSQLIQLQLSHEQTSQQLKQTRTLLDSTGLRHKEEVQQLKQLNQQFKAEAEFRKGVRQQNRSCQTEEKELASQSVQTRQKKTRNEGMQTAEEMSRQKSNRSHSRSLGNKKSKRQKSVSYQQSSFNHSRRNQEEEPNEEIEVEEDVDQCFEDLTKKWLQLKEHNLSQLKQSYMQSKQKCPQVEEKTPAHAPRQFTEPEDPDQIDDNELNRLLKSKDFSASRLLNCKGVDRQSYYMQSLNTQQTTVGERRQAEQFPRKEYPLNIANKRDATASISAVSRREEMKLSVFGNDNDLMDLVDSLS